MRLVAKDPAGRPGSAAEVAQQAGRLRHDLRDDVSACAAHSSHPLAAAAAVPPPPPAMASAAVADSARWQVPAAPRPASRAWTDARRLRRRPVLVLACVAIAGLIGMVLAVTVGVAPVRHLAGAPPSAQPGHPASGTVAGPPARQPSSASPSRGGRPATSPSDTRTVPVVVSNHRTITGSTRRRERIRRHRNGSDTYHSRGRSHGHGERSRLRGRSWPPKRERPRPRRTGTRRSSAFQVSQPPRRGASGFQNSATGLDLGFYAACSYSLRRPPRTGRRLILQF